MMMMMQYLMFSAKKEPRGCRLDTGSEALWPCEGSPLSASEGGTLEKVATRKLPWPTSAGRPMLTGCDLEDVLTADPLFASLYKKKSKTTQRKIRRLWPAGDVYKLLTLLERPPRNGTFVPDIVTPGLQDLPPSLLEDLVRKACSTFAPRCALSYLDGSDNSCSTFKRHSSLAPVVSTYVSCSALACAN
ncbi:hypothetical protein DIPPA_07905 [Diplonema papillatum]|nr:hypothetical protein DIPPA_07905 [Diplonema papillatum]